MHRTDGTPQEGGDLGRAVAAGAGQQDLGPAQGERIGGPETGLQLALLLGRQGADEQGRLHGGPSHPNDIPPLGPRKTPSGVAGSWGRVLSPDE